MSNAANKASKTPLSNRLADCRSSRFPCNLPEGLAEGNFRLAAFPAKETMNR